MRLVYTAPRYHTNQHFPVKALLEAGHEVSFLVLREGQSETHEALVPNVLGCSPTFERLRRLSAALRGAEAEAFGGIPPVFGFWREMRRLRPSAVVVRRPFSAYGLLAVSVTKLIGARLVLYTQATKRHRPNRWWKRAVLALVPRLVGARGWITPVLGLPGQREWPGTPLRYVPFVMPPRTAPDDRRWFAGGAVNVLAIGKYLPRKNHRLFLEAVRGLSRHHPVRATIIGECSTSEHRRELEDVRRHRARLGLDDKVRLEVNLPFPEVQRRYAAHDLFVLASRDDPAAVSPLEAMAHSLPVICGDSNGTACYVRPGENGFVFRADDPDDLEVCMTRIAGDREKLVEMGRRGYELVISEHAPERYVETLMAMLGAPR